MSLTHNFWVDQETLSDIYQSSVATLLGNNAL